MADSTLAAIRKKVRRLTRTPSEQQLSTADIDEYVNTFILYDFPQSIRLFSLRQTLTFYTQANVDVYETSANPLDALYDFKDLYTAVYDPIYIAGREAYLSRSVSELTSLYPLTNSEVVIGTGDGITVTTTGTLSNIPVLKDHVVFTAIDTAGRGMEIHDDSNGTLTGDGLGVINYVTGVYTITFGVAPATGENITALTIPYKSSRPDTVLYFENKFIVRPVPDMGYPIQIEVDARPTSLLNDPTAVPELEQWWQYIAYGAAKKVFEDRGDSDDLQGIMPEFKNQELLVLRRSNVQIAQNRTSTIYSNGAWIGFGSGRINKGF